MMLEDVRIPMGVGCQPYGGWVLVRELLEEENRCPRLNGYAWNWSDGPVLCTFRGREIGSQEAKRAILKEK